MHSKLEVLSRDDIEALHRATLHVLGKVGVDLLEPRAAQLLREAGAVPAPRGTCIRIPEGLVKDALVAVPKRWTWHAREPRHSLRVGEGGRTRLGPGSSCTKIFDYEQGVTRAPTVRDGDGLVRLMDALDFVDINYTPVSPSDAEGSIRYRETATLVRDIQNTSKVMVGPSFDGTMARDGLEVAKILAGGEEELRRRPTLAGYCDPVSPLVHDRAMTETLIEYAKLGQPVFVTCLDVAGASSPASLAGTLVQQNAEVLSGVVIAHLVNREAPVVYGCVSGAMDMKAATTALGGPEFGLLSAASVQLAHSYGLPCSAGAQSDARVPDAQAAFEKGMSLLSSVLAGADMVDLFFGSFDAYNTTCPEQVILDHEMAGYAFRYADGLTLDPLNAALDLLEEVGSGGSFLRHPKALRDTMNRMREEYYFPSFVDRRAESGLSSYRSFLEHAHAEARRIVGAHQPAPVDPGTLKEMRAALQRIRQDETA